MLHLSRSQTSACIQGKNKVNVFSHHSVNIHLKSRHSNWHSTLTSAILPSITGLTPAANMDISFWNIPDNINLADEMFHQCGTIDNSDGAGTFV
jgi:hypothetical protein